MCEHIEASDIVALRREARRRKILENSVNRLKLIEGLHSSNAKSSLESDASEFIGKLTDGTSVTKRQENEDKKIQKPDKMCIQSNFREALKQNDDLRKISEYIISSEKDEREVNGESDNEEVGSIPIFKEDRIIGLQKNTLLDVLIRKRLHFVMLAVIVNALLYFNFGYLFYENIFCPFYTLKILELIGRRGMNEEIQPFLIFILASLPKSLQKCAKIVFSIFPGLFSDLLLYIFTFSIGTKILSSQI